MNTVDYLLKHSFASHSLEQKLEIKRLGRPMPDLKLRQTCKDKNTERIRKFNCETYNKNEWICGCDIKDAVFCFPCLLFTGETSWAKTGVKDLRHLADEIQKHDVSSVHKNNVMNLAVLGRGNIRSQLDSCYRRQIQLQNEKVKKNREVLSLLINCIRFCGAFELALRGHDESNSASNPGIYRGLVDFSAQLNDALKTHLDKATVFKGTSKTIQNELLDCMLEICHEEISKEIIASDFVAVIADETTDISNVFQMVLVYRYIVHDKVVERFWRYINPSKHDAASLSSCILKELDEHLENTPNKLIAQSYDGASVMSGKGKGVQTRVREHYPFASYVHCHAHQLNLVMSNAASINRNVRIFFANLGAVCTFFSKSPQRTEILNEIVGRRLPRTSDTRWNFHTRAVNIVYENREELVECMEAIETRDNIKQQSTIAQASGLKHILKDEDFIFWLTIFHQIMPHVDMLYNQIQKRAIDPAQIKCHINSFQSNMEQLRENIETVSVTSESETQLTRKRKHQTNHESRIREAKEVCDVILMQTKERFDFVGHLSAANLFLSDKFPEYDKEFPVEYLTSTIKAYPFLDRKKLETELQLIYRRNEFRTVSGAIPLLSFLIDTNLVTNFSESVLLLKIIVTIPMSTSEAERCFSTLKRIKTFLRNTMLQDRLSALAMLSIERDFIMDIPDFNNKVIDKFSQRKERRMDFAYEAY